MLMHTPFIKYHIFRTTGMIQFIYYYSSPYIFNFYSACFFSITIHYIFCYIWFHYELLTSYFFSSWYLWKLEICNLIVIKTCTFSMCNMDICNMAFTLIKSIPRGLWRFIRYGFSFTFILNLSSKNLEKKILHFSLLSP